MSGYYQSQPPIKLGKGFLNAHSGQKDFAETIREKYRPHFNQLTDRQIVKDFLKLSELAAYRKINAIYVGFGNIIFDPFYNENGEVIAFRLFTLNRSDYEIDEISSFIGQFNNNFQPALEGSSIGPSPEGEIILNCPGNARRLLLNVNNLYKNTPPSECYWVF